MQGMLTPPLFQQYTIYPITAFAYFFNLLRHLSTYCHNLLVNNDAASVRFTVYSSVYSSVNVNSPCICCYHATAST